MAEQLSCLHVSQPELVSTPTAHLTEEERESRCLKTPELRWKGAGGSEVLTVAHWIKRGVITTGKTIKMGGKT